VLAASGRGGVGCYHRGERKVLLFAQGNCFSPIAVTYTGGFIASL